MKEMHILRILIGADCSTVHSLQLFFRCASSNSAIKLRAIHRLLDRIFGTFREYNNEDRINPAYQLDPSTGKTFSSAKTQ